MKRSKFFNELISDKDEHPLKIPEKSFPFDTFQFCKDFIYEKIEHPLNIYEKSLPFDTFQFCKGLYLIKLNIR